MLFSLFRLNFKQKLPHEREYIGFVAHLTMASQTGKPAVYWIEALADSQLNLR